MCWMWHKVNFFKWSWRLKSPVCVTVLPIAGVILFPRISKLCEIQTASSWIWTQAAMSISNNNVNYTLQMNVCVCVCVCMYKLADHIKGKLKAPFSIATTQRCKKEHYYFPWIAQLTLDPYLIMLSGKQRGIKYHFMSLWYDSTLGLNPSLPDHSWTLTILTMNQ